MFFFGKLYFRSFLFAFLCLCSSFSFSSELTGNCHLYQDNVTGEYRIICEGDGLEIRYSDVTNEVFVIGNCLELKTDLLYVVTDVFEGIWSSRTNNLHKAIGELYASMSYVDSLPDDLPEKHPLQESLSTAQSALSTADNGLQSSLANVSSLRYQIESIQCGECNTNSSGSGSCDCCDVDLQPIIDGINNVASVANSITNNLAAIRKLIELAGGRPEDDIEYWMLELSNGRLHPSRSYSYIESANTVLDSLQAICWNLSDELSSANNYLYRLSYVQLDPYINQATNYFTFFRKQVSVLSPLSESPSGVPYYDFLTNHYVQVSLGNSSSTLTNWFSRVETLLASLVFSDAESMGTNQPDTTEDESAAHELVSRASAFAQPLSSQMQSFRESSVNLITLIGRFNTLFSSVSSPSEIQLATLPFGSSGLRDSSSSSSVVFSTSEISSLVSICRSVTTLAWVGSGLFLAYWLCHWCLFTSYKLAIFCWSVLSSIVGKGGGE